MRDLYAGSREKDFEFKNGVLKYAESASVFFEVLIRQSKTDEFTDLAYLSWINGKGSGIRLLGYILKKLYRYSVNNNRTIKLLLEPTTEDGWNFVKKLSKLGFNIHREESEVNWGCTYFVIEVNQGALNVLVKEA